MELVSDWNEDKNKWLKKHRGISFEDVLVAIETDQILDIKPHPNKKKYPNQKQLIINHCNYAYIVPYITTKDGIFLKTIYPSRKETKKHFEGGLDA